MTLAGPKPGSALAGMNAQSQRISLFRQTSLTLPTDNSRAVVPWDLERANFKFGITHSTTVSPENVTIEAAGRYQIDLSISATMLSDPTGTASWEVWLRINGGTGGNRQAFWRALALGGAAWILGTNSFQPITIADELLLAAGDVLTVEVGCPVPTSTASQVDADGNRTWLTVQRVP